MKPILLLLPVVVFAGCHRPHDTAHPETELPTAATSFVTVVAESRPVTEDVVGTVRSETRASVEAKVAGRIESMAVDLGDRVEEGQVLAVIDAREVRARLDRAQADRDQAARDWKRSETLLKRDVASRQEYDAAEARFRAADAALQEARAMLAYVEVRAPFGGAISRRLANPGDFASPGKPLLEMESPESLRFELDVPEALIASMETGAAVDVVIPSLSRTIAGKVAEIAPAADSGTRTFPVRITLPKVEGLRTGQFGRAAIPVGNRSSVHIPAEALVVRGQMEMVFVKSGDRVSMRLVRTGKHSDGEVEILSGLSPGEEVAVTHAGKLLDGQPIAP